MTRLALAVILTITLGACTAAEVAADGPTEGPRVRIELLEFSFAPAVIEVPADTRFTVEVRNSGRMDHDLTIDGLHLKVIVKPGRSAVRILGPLPRDAMYDVVCTLVGHVQLGMVGRLVVR